MPRKSVQRNNSSTSLASSASASSTSTVSTAAPLTNGAAPAANGAGEASSWAARKKAPRGLWTASKSEPISGISTARPQSIATAGTGTSAASAISALHAPAPMVPSQNNGQTQSQHNGAQRPPQQQDSSAILHLIPMNGTFERKTITVPFFPDVLRIGRQTNNKTIPTPLNGYFDSKVLSRQHAEIWAERNGKISIRDVKSSNGTFVNGARLSQENRDSDPHELHEQDVLELGIDIVSEDQKTIVHHKVAARVEHAGIYPNTGNSLMDLNFGELENQPMSNLMGPGGQQQMGNIRGRTTSQGSINSGRLQGPPGPMNNNTAAMQQQQQQRHTNFWLQPITMEQVVKKLNAELKAAKQQSQDLHQTAHYINSVLAADPKKEPTRHSPISSVKISPIKDLKARFSDPPAPPPQQPLPEKPDAHQPSLRRTDTERPKSTGSPARPETNAQVSSLADALNSARKELESQGLRLRDLEALLTEERKAREDAEERANRLEQESHKEQELSEPALPNGDGHSSDVAPELEGEVISKENEAVSSPVADAATSRLQQRLDLMMSEMNEMKQQMENYRQRAETAEAERSTLAEMVEKIRQEDAKRAKKEAKRRSRSDSGLTKDTANTAIDASSDEDAEEGEITIVNDKEVETNGVLSRGNGLQNGHAVGHENSTDSDKASRALATRRTNRGDLALAHGAPVVSIFTVVALGVAVMAWLNSYPKVER
ncbi:hypothetical protein P154DRAFT_420272 [Amniculicola lignicola CBS 123094]|uniref:FHA domain-containing protein n=1 Tax=Amniculicola lignicola CBS 123094 TaxID=1392246 RepID=A0A6A5X364_9PLEO|nr:hypothetical protein P154DRAFT_420272 [Amniculicola lignicola CBS 123094]